MPRKHHDPRPTHASPRNAPFLEEGEAFAQLSGLSVDRRRQASQANAETWHTDVVVIGGGQAGLAVGYHLAKKGLRFVILDAEARIGDTWRKRWDSLRLFTPARYDGLTGMRFPAPANYFPTKDEMADYLQAYAARFALPVKSGVRVDRLVRRDGRYHVTAGPLAFQADQVVVALSSYQQGRMPVFARDLAPGLVQIHSLDYRNPGQLADGPVLIVGAGNSGAEIAHELARQPGRRVWLSGPDTGHVPFRMDGLAAKLVLSPLVLRFVFHHLLTIRTPIGRKARPKIMRSGAPLIRVKPHDLAADGVERVARVVGARDGKPLLADGRLLEAANIVWCTGFHGGLSFIDLPIFEEDGEPRHQGGVVPEAPGLYFVGLHFLYSMSSTMIHGVSRDAARVVKAVAARARQLPRDTVPTAVPPATATPLAS